MPLICPSIPSTKPDKQPMSGAILLLLKGSAWITLVLVSLATISSPASRANDS